MDIRKRVTEKFQELLEANGVSSSVPMSINIEKGVLNHTIKSFNEMSVPIENKYYWIPSFENRHFVRRYKNNAYNLIYVMKQPSSKVIERLLNKELKTFELAHLRPSVLWPDGPYAQTEKKLKEEELAKEVTANQQLAPKGMFRCGKCKSDKTAYYQMQTRSADEPMTTFVMCIDCGKRWKF